MTQTQTIGRVEQFLKGGSGRWEQMRVTSKEARRIITTYQPRANNAPSLIWHGHFRVGNFGYCLAGQMLTRTGYYE